MWPRWLWARIVFGELSSAAHEVCFLAAHASSFSPPSADDSALLQLGLKSDVESSELPSGPGLKGHLLIYDDVVREQLNESDRTKYAYLTMWFDAPAAPSGDGVAPGSLLGRSDLVSSALGIKKIADGLLAVGAKYPLAVATNNKELMASLNKYSNVRIIKIAKRHILKEQFRSDKKNHLQKLWLFGLDHFDKFLYLDADVEVRENVDHLFDEDLDGGRKVRVQQDDYKCQGEKQELVCSGVMLFKPSQALKQGLVAEAGKRPKWKGDQAIIESFLGESFLGVDHKKALGFKNRTTGISEQYRVSFFPLNVVSFSKCNPNASLAHHDHNGKH